MRLTLKALLAALAVSTAPAVLAQTTTLTASNWLPTSHLLYAKLLVPWTQQVEKATEGRVKFNILPKPVSAPPGTFDAIRDGLADVSLTVHGYTPGRFVLTKVAEMPFLGDKSEHVSVAYQRIHERYLENGGEHKGVVVLSVFTHGPGNILNTKRPINSLADLQGMKFRVGGGVLNDVAVAVGTTPLLRPVTEVYEMISNGVADGVFLSKEAIAAFKLERFIKHVTLVPGGMYNTSFVMMINEASWNKLPKRDQEAMMSVSREKASRMVGRAFDESDDVGLAAGKAAKMTIITASPKFVGEMKQRFAKIEADFNAESASRGWDGKRFLAELRAEVKKVEAGK